MPVRIDTFLRYFYYESSEIGHFNENPFIQNELYLITCFIHTEIFFDMIKQGQIGKKRPMTTVKRDKKG